MQKRYFIFFILFCASILNAGAQKLYFRKFTPDQENPETKINKLLQDKNGFIWLGTSNGLVRFDGSSITHFGAGNVTALYQDDSLKIWAGYKDGKIAFFKDDKLQLFSPEEGLPKVDITSIVEDKENKLWFATYGEGVYYYQKSRLYNINVDDGLADNYAYSIAADDAGNVWVGTDRGINRIHISNGKKMLQTLNEDNGLPDNLVTCLKYKNGELWIGTQSKGVCIFNTKTAGVKVLDNTWNYGQVNDFQFITNELHIATDGNGLISLKQNGKFFYETYKREELYGNYKITDLLFDMEGNLWVAGGTEIICAANADIKTVSLKNLPELQSVRALQKVENEYWLGTENGVFIYDIKTAKLFRTKFQQLNSANITSIVPAGNNLCFSTLGKGIYIYNISKKWLKQFTEKDGLVNDNILSVTSKGNKFYIATLGGASIAEIINDKINFRNIDRSNGLPADYIYQVYEDKNENTWFCTDGKGLIKLKDNKYTIYDETNGLPAKTVISVTEGGGKLWIVTADNGLFAFDGNHFKRMDPGNGFKNYSIRSLVYDNGNLLLAHKNGLDIYDPKTGHITTYRQELELNDSDPELNAWTRQKDVNEGFLFAFGKTLVQYFNNAPGKKDKPQTRITNLLVFLDPAKNDQHEFGYDENHISFSYTGLWFHNPAEVTYSIKLEGYDLDWVNTRNSFFTYPNLPPGKYTFRVRSSATGNFENASEAKYDFTITAPFWKQVWFYISLILLLLGSVYFFIRWREKRLKKQADISKQNIEFQYETLKSQVNPHFLFNSFNTLAGVIETDQQTAVQYVEQLSDFFRSLLMYKDKNVINLAEELQLLNNYFFLQKMRFGDNLLLEINIGAEFYKYKIPPMCLQLLVENAINHNIISREKPLRINIKATENAQLIVINNLQKRSQRERSTGLGLSNIKSRYSLLTNEQVIVNETDKHFEVILPLLKP